MKKCDIMSASEPEQAYLAKVSEPYWKFCNWEFPKE